MSARAARAAGGGRAARLGLAIILFPAVGCPLGSAMESPRASRLSSAAIDSARRISEATGGRALLVSQYGRIIHESYGGSWNADDPHPVFSITKALAGLAFAEAAAAGRIDLDAPVADVLTGWRADRWKRRITVRQLLDQTAGIDPGFPILYSRAVSDKNARAVQLPMVAEPGVLFDYGPSYFEVLDAWIQRGKDQTSRAFIEANVLRPARVHAGAQWRMDREGNTFLSTGAEFTGRGLIGLGRWVLASGRLNAVGRGSDANPMYGLGFWNNRAATRSDAVEISVEDTLGREFSPGRWARSCLSKSAPPDLVAMIGSGGQRCFVIPSRGLVVARFGASAAFDDAAFLRALLAR